MKKINYKGRFNWCGEVTELYRWAFSESQTKEVFFRRLAKLHDVSIWTVRNHFSGEKDNYKITLEE